VHRGLVRAVRTGTGRFLYDLDDCAGLRVEYPRAEEEEAAIRELVAAAPDFTAAQINPHPPAATRSRAARLRQRRWGRLKVKAGPQNGTRLLLTPRHHYRQPQHQPRKELLKLVRLIVSRRGECAHANTSAAAPTTGGPDSVPAPSTR
jgi:hypothetical protein